jgi:hypothetical protein
MSRNSHIIIQGIILSLFILYIGTFSVIKFFGSSPIYSHSQPSYYSQYNYRYNSGYISAYNYWPYAPINANVLRSSGASNYVAGYGQTGWSPYLMPGNPDNHGNINYNSHIYVEDPLSYAYYTNPWLLEPRRMNNHQRMYPGLGAQGFWY